MIVYKDRWWCGADKPCAKATTCDRVMRPEDIQAATKWWGDEDFPVALCLEPTCFEPAEGDIK